MADDGFNFVQLLIIIAAVYFLVRYCRPGASAARNGSASGSALSTAAASSRNPAERYRAQIETVASMFPQYGRREILWDLQANRGNVNATTERILMGRGLDPVRAAPLPSWLRCWACSRNHCADVLRGILQPPQSFQPQFPPSAAESQRPIGTGAPPKPQFQDLISRYELQGRVAQDTARDSEEPVAVGKSSSRSPFDGTAGKQVWSQSKSERHATMVRKREEMVLAARRKMEERDRMGR